MYFIFSQKQPYAQISLKEQQTDVVLSFKSVRSLAGSIKNDSGIVDEYINNAGTWEMAVQAGLNHGGSRENTDLSIVPGSEPAPESFIDFCPGATGTG